jgi:hypothetical protein
MVVQVATLRTDVQFLWSKIEWTKTRCDRRPSQFSRGASRSLDNVNEMKVMSQLGERNSTLPQHHDRFAQTVGPAPGTFNRLV